MIELQSGDRGFRTVTSVVFLGHLRQMEGKFP
jgi:hypothetical protein